MSSYVKSMLCLAKSRRPGGVCVAGREIVDGKIGKWLRPVTIGGAVPAQMLTLDNGEGLRLGDVVEVTLLGSRPHTYQIENHLVDLTRPWRFARAGSAAEISAALDASIKPLWAGFWSTKHGVRDRVLPIFVKSAEGSLRFIEVADLRISTRAEGRRWGNEERKTRGRFTHGGRDYCLPVTDLAVENRFEIQPEGDYHVGAARLCVSLGDVNEKDGFAYKLIASVM